MGFDINLKHQKKKTYMTSSDLMDKIIQNNSELFYP